MNVIKTDCLLMTLCSHWKIQWNQFQNFEEIKKKNGDLAMFYINKTKTKIMCKHMTATKQKELRILTDCSICKIVDKIFRYKPDHEVYWSI